MLDTSAVVVGLTGAVLLAASLVPDPDPLQPRADHAPIAVAAVGGGLPHAPAGPDAALLFRPEPMTHVVWLDRRPAGSAAVPQPAATDERKPDRASDEPATGKAPRGRTVGCEGAVSPLVKTSPPVPGLCVT
jgi:hypothetical protein